MRPQSSSWIRPSVFCFFGFKSSGCYRFFFFLEDSLKWIPGFITKKTGPVSYEVEVDGCTLRRHVDQILPFRDFRNNEEGLKSNIDISFENSSIPAEQPVSPPIQPSSEASPLIVPSLMPNVSPNINDNRSNMEITNNDITIQREEEYSGDVIETENYSTRKSTRVKTIPDRIYLIRYLFF